MRACAAGHGAKRAPAARADVSAVNAACARAPRVAEGPRRSPHSPVNPPGFALKRSAASRRARCAATRRGRGLSDCVQRPALPVAIAARPRRGAARLTQARPRACALQRPLQGDAGRLLAAHGPAEAGVLLSGTRLRLSAGLRGRWASHTPPPARVFGASLTLSLPRRSRRRRCCRPGRSW